MTSTRKRSTSPGGIAANVGRGALIGAAELVPGVSGGTIALITGVYERIIFAANDAIDALKKPGTERARALKAVDWALLLPIAVGMFMVLTTLSGVMKGFVENHPETARGLFFGMVLASISVPLLLVDRQWLRTKGKPALGAAFFVIGAVAAFVLSGMPPGDIADPPLYAVFAAAAVAVCALVLPGVSGSFFLLAVGIYSATLTAVDERNVVYIGVFALGAITGLLLFVRALRSLLAHHEAPTLITMAGLMTGSLRALWPWQSEDRTILAPHDPVGLPLLLMVVGVVAVATLVLLDRTLSTRSTSASRG